MTYKITKTDGSLLTEIIDSAIDQTATDLTLIGKNVAGYGQFVNENFVKLLENFSSTSVPSNPIIGQLWFDTSENRLKVYDGNGFKSGSGPIVSGTQPVNLVQGDIWINSSENQLYFYDGTELQLAGPVYKDSQGLSGFTVDTIYDINQLPKVIVRLWVAQTLIGIFSKESIPFTPYTAISGFTGDIYPGFNQGTIPGMSFNATAASAKTLVDAGGNFKSASSFLSAEVNTGTLGSVTIQNATPLILGPSQNTEIRVSATAAQILSNSPGQDFTIKVNNAFGLVDAFTIKSIDQRVGLFNATPDYTLDVNGDLRVVGNLIVEGTSTTINTTQLTIEDKNIILANALTPTNITAAGAGITIKGTTDKTILWNATSTAFDISEDINLASGKGLYINGVLILDESLAGQLSVLTAKANIDSPAFTGTVSGITKAMVGLGNVDNTADVNKPVPASMIAALLLKQDTSEKDAFNGYVGLNQYRINFKNNSNTFTSYLSNANTGSRIYTFPNRDGNIADNTDLEAKANLAAPTFSGTLTASAITYTGMLTGNTSIINIGAGQIYKDITGNVGIGVTPTARNNTRFQIVDGIGFPAIAVASTDANTLDDYREATYTATATGMTTSPTGTVTFVKIGRSVNMEIPTISGTSNATTFTLTGGPATMRPTADRFVIVKVQDNSGVVNYGNAVIGTDGTITVYKDAANGVFTASGTKQIVQCSIAYII